MHWTIDYATGTYHSTYPTPTGNPADPTLTAHGVRQSEELATYYVSEEFPGPRPWRIYSSPFYRCLQTIRPSVEALDGGEFTGGNNAGRREKGVRIENGLGFVFSLLERNYMLWRANGYREWFGSSTYFDHPPPASVSELYEHFPSIIPNPSTSPKHNIHVIPSKRGETIPQLHNRVATALAAIIADADADIRTEEEREAEKDSNSKPSSKAILICSHAATLIAMGRALTGNMPDDPNTEDFHVYTAGMSTYVRRKTQQVEYHSKGEGSSLIAAGTTLIPESEVRVPVWEGGRGVGGGWDCVRNCDCSFLSGGEERGW